MKRLPVRISAWGIVQRANRKDYAINWPRSWISLRGLKHTWSLYLNTYRITMIVTSLAYSFEPAIWMHVTHLYRPDKLFRSHPKGHLRTQLTITKCWHRSIARIVLGPIWKDREDNNRMPKILHYMSWYQLVGVVRERWMNLKPCREASDRSLVAFVHS